MEIDYQPVQGSSSVAAMAYDVETATMYVKFHDGAEYRWPEVSVERYTKLRRAASVGRHLAKEFPKGERVNRVAAAEGRTGHSVDHRQAEPLEEVLEASLRALDRKRADAIPCSDKSGHPGT